MYRVRNGNKPTDPVPGEWFCTQCLHQAIETEFRVTGELLCSKCGACDVFDAWEDPLSWGFQPRLEQPPPADHYLCMVCGLLALEREFVNFSPGRYGEKWLCDCGSNDPPEPAHEVWQRQIETFAEIGVEYHPENGWCLAQETG